jgi:hypothetical protein
LLSYAKTVSHHGTFTVAGSRSSPLAGLSCIPLLPTESSSQSPLSIHSSWDLNTLVASTLDVLYSCIVPVVWYAVSWPFGRPSQNQNNRSLAVIVGSNASAECIGSGSCCYLLSRCLGYLLLCHLVDSDSHGLFLLFILAVPVALLPHRDSFVVSYSGSNRTLNSCGSGTPALFRGSVSRNYRTPTTIKMWVSICTSSCCGTQ